jgi:hypothetical protein
MRNDTTALEIRPAGGEVKVGAAVQLNLFALNKNGRTDLILANMAGWSSSDGHIAEVNRQGRLMPRRAGSVTITATHADKRVMAVFTVVD